MKYLVVLCCMVAAVVCEKYTTKYDNINLDEILLSDRLFKAYLDCILDRGKCTPEGKELRGNMHDAITTGCKDCSETQQKGASKVIDHMIKHRPEAWREVAAKFDPDGKWRQKYEARARELGIEFPK